MAAETFTGGASPADALGWSDDGAWSTGEPPGTGHVVDASGYSTLDITNTTSPTAEEQIAGLDLTSGANLNIGANLLEVSGSGLASFGGTGSTIVINGGLLTVDSAVTSATGLVEDGGGYTYAGSGNSETVDVTSGGIFTIDGSGNSPTVNLSGSGKLFLDTSGNDPTVNMTGGQLEVEATGNAGAVNLLGSGQLIVNGSVAFNATLAHLGAGTTLQVENQGAETAHSFSTDAATNTITLDFTAGSTSLSYGLKFDPTTDPISNLSVTISNGAFDITAAATVCFVTGSVIRTTRGEVPVERLSVGDLILTTEGRTRPIVWIGHRKVARPAPEAWPVRIMAGAFGEGLPERDLFLSPGHAVCVDLIGEVFVPVGELVNDTTIIREAATEITYWHVELESHDVLLAEGMPCESYMDAGNRGFFGREYGRLESTDPERVAESLTRYARPFVEGGPLVAAIRERLAARAETIGARPAQRAA